MASLQQIETTIEMIYHLPAPMLEEINRTNSGIRAVLKLLDESPGYVTAGDVSANLAISSARVAVLIKKLVNKGIITRQHALTDGRVIVIRLTPLGEEIKNSIKNNLRALIADVIDEVGYERISEFISILRVINKVTAKYKFRGDCLDKYLDKISVQGEEK